MDKRYGTSVWQEGLRRGPAHAKLSGDLKADVVVVGAGITGLTAASILLDHGKSVVVIDMGEGAKGESAFTSAHLTEVFDDRYFEIARNFGQEGATLVAESARRAIELIEHNARTIECAFERVPGYLFAENDEDLSVLQAELNALMSVGTRASLADGFPLPFNVKGALRVEHQAQFQPLAYLWGLEEQITKKGGRIFENTRALSFEDGTPCRVETDSGVLTAEKVIVATNVPVCNRVALLTKIAAYRSYVTAWTIKGGSVSGLYWDTHDPYHYIRTYQQNEHSILIVGGEDHKTGADKNTRSHYDELESYARSHFDVDSLVAAWSGQIIESSDGLPYIGLNSGSDHTYVATGFGGQGLTGGTIAASVITGEILNRREPWADIYDARRVKPIAQAGRYVSENVDYPSHAILDRLAAGDVDDVSEIPRGEGRLMRSHGRMLAVYRDDDNRIHTRSATCTHLGCHVRWNNAESSWDCPCHGGRFDCKGKVLNGPALVDLKEVDNAESAKKAPVQTPAELALSKR